jgi:hypothetical protein
MNFCPLMKFSGSIKIWAKVKEEIQSKELSKSSAPKDYVPSPTFGNFEIYRDLCEVK